MNRIVLCVGLCTILVALGCSKEERDQLMDQASDTVNQIATESKEATDSLAENLSENATSVTEELNLAGSIEFGATPAEKTKACYVELIPASSSRPAFLQIRSYKTPDQESFPSVFLQGEVEASSMGDLANKTVPMQMFVQVQSGGTVAYTDANTAVQVTVNTVEEKQLTATFAEGSSLAKTDGSAPMPIQGSITGVLN